jgi:hypothetical protein
MFLRILDYLLCLFKMATEGRKPNTRSESKKRRHPDDPRVAREIVVVDALPTFTVLPSSSSQSESLKQAEPYTILSPTKWDEFFSFMRDVAKTEDGRTIFTENFRAIGDTLERDIRFFCGGQAGIIPNEWIIAFNQFTTRQSDPEFRQFVQMQHRLKTKIEADTDHTSLWLENYSKGFPSSKYGTQNQDTVAKQAKKRRYV